MVNILCSESVSAKKKRVIIKELVQGREAATQLKLVLQKPFETDGSLSVEELMANVLRSFTETLSVLTSSSSSADEPLGGGEVTHNKNLLNSGENGSPVVASGNDLKSEDSSESRKGFLPAKKDRRGCYKRRKSAQTWTTVTRTPDDNHAWRKYGQKEIQNSKFPRSYFRCTRKYDQGCRATKQVQRTQENPDMYRITYIGIHTCKAIPKSPHLVTDTTTWESFLVNSHPDDSKVPNEQDHPICLPSLTTIKQEYPKEDTPSDVTDHKLDPSPWSDLKDLEPSKPAIVMPLKMASDNADTMHSCTGSQSLDMDFGVDSVHFGTDFHFDENQLL